MSTQDEMREAYFLFMRKEKAHTGSFQTIDSQTTWQAAVKWATERQIEKVNKICDDENAQGKLQQKHAKPATQEDIYWGAWGDSARAIKTAIRNQERS